MTETPEEQSNQPKKQTVQRNIEDLEALDFLQRNLLHRACMQQQFSLIKEIIDNYQDIVLVEQKNKINEYKKRGIDEDDKVIKDLKITYSKKTKQFINKKDIFSFTPILCSAFRGAPNEETKQQLVDILEFLVKEKANYKKRNKTTRWNVLYWHAHYGNIPAVRFLMVKPKIGICEPDYQGYYPIDLAGKQGHMEIVKILIYDMVIQIEQYQNEITYNENNTNKYLQSPLLLSSILYWSCYFEDSQLLERILRFDNLFVEVAMEKYQYRTCYHVCAEKGFSTNLSLLLEETQIRYRKHLKQYNNFNTHQFYFDIECNDFFSMNIVKNYHFFSYCQHDMKVYTETFKMIIHQYAFWVFNYVRIIKDTESKQIDLILFDQPDFYGNSPMHISCMAGNQECLKLLIQKGANIQLENKEGFSPREISQLPEIRDIFLNQLEDLTKELSEQQKKKNQEFLQIMLEEMQLEAKNIQHHFYKHQKKKQILYKKLAQKKQKLQSKKIKKNPKGHEKYKEDIETPQRRSVSIMDMRPQKLAPLPTLEVKVVPSEIEMPSNVPSDQQSLLSSSRKKIQEKETQKDLPPKIKPEDEDSDLEYPKKFEMFSFQKIDNDETLELFREFEQYSPDFVIKFNLQDQSIKFRQSKEQKQKAKQAQANRVNFYLLLLENAKFQINICKSACGGKVYAMLNLSEKELQIQCTNLGLSAKLMYSFQRVLFEYKHRDKYEPFRSQMRQEIIRKYIGTIIDLDLLVKDKIVDVYYPMHTGGGQNKLYKLWLSKKQKWTPLTFIRDFIDQGPKINFTEISQLRSYLGNQISFYLAWKSFNICLWGLIALPGLAYQIYMMYTEDYYGKLAIYWIIFCQMFFAVQIQLWKRKQWEINYRWGVTELSEDKESAINKEFFGDDVKIQSQFISDITGALIKYQTPWDSQIVFFGSMPIFLSLIVIVNTIALTLATMNVETTDPNEKTMLGIANAVSVSVFNMLYNSLVILFVRLENNKYDQDKNDSQITKLFTFQFVNFTINIFLNMYVQIISAPPTEPDPNGIVVPAPVLASQLFSFLWPMIVSKYYFIYFLTVSAVSKLASNGIVPVIIKKIKEFLYFKQVTNLQTAQKEKQNRTYPEDALHILKICYLMIVGRVRQFRDFAYRSVFQIQFGRKDLHFVDNANMDDVEMNSQLKYYDDVIVLNQVYTLDCIQLFQCFIFVQIIPIGPLIYVILETAALKGSIFAFLFGFQRTLNKPCRGIGLWLHVMDIIQYVTIVTNLLLIYIDQQYDIEHFSFFQLDVSQENASLEKKYNCIWAILIIFIFLVSFKMLSSKVMGDVPLWVKEEFQSILSKDNNLDDLLEQTIKNNKKEIKDQNEKIFGLENEWYSKIKIQLDEIDQYKIQQFEKRNEIRSLLEENQDNNKDNPQLMQKIYNVYYLQYVEIENQLLLQRLKDMMCMELDYLFVCGLCKYQQAIFECQYCCERYCKLCYDNDHFFEKHPISQLKASVDEDEDQFDFSEYSVHNKDEVMQNKPLLTNITEETPHDTVVDFEKQAESYIHVKKIQKFYFPDKKDNQNFKDLIRIFQLFVDIYLESNNLQKGVQSVPKINQGVFRTSQVNNSIIVQKFKSLTQFLQINYFTVEDKLMLNKIFFQLNITSFKEPQLDEFTKQVQQVQGSLFQNKLKVLFDVSCMGNSDEITKNQIYRIFSSSVLSNRYKQIIVKDLVNLFFKYKQTKIPFKTFLQVIINSQIAFEVMIAITNHDYSKYNKLPPIKNIPPIKVQPKAKK